MNFTIERGILNNVLGFEVFNNSRGDNFKKYKRALENLSKNNLIISDINIEKAVTFTGFFEETLQARRQFLNKSQDSLASHLKGDFRDAKDIDRFDLYYEESIEEDDAATKIDLLEESQRGHLHRFVNNNFREEKHSNQSLLTTKNTFILYPLRIIVEGMSIFVDVRMTIYKHGYAILNFSTYLKNIDLEDFNRSQWGTNIDSAFLPSFMLSLENKDQYSGASILEKTKYNKLGRCKDLASAIKRYEKIIKLAIGYQASRSESESFHTLMISNEKDLGKINTTNYRENIYKLLHSPILTKPPQTYLEKFFNNNLFEEKGFMNTYGNQHRLVYIVPEEMFKKIQKELPQCTEEPITEHFYEAFHGDFFFAIEKLMLRKMSDWKYMHNFFGDTISSRKLYRIDLNRIYESRFENNQVFYQYSSMLELVDALFKSCIDKNVTNILEENKDRVLETSELRRNIIISEVSVLTSILVILLTAILSIPALTQTMEFFNIKNDFLITFSYAVILILVIITVIAAFRDKILVSFQNIISFPKNVWRQYVAIRNTKNYFRRKNNKK